MEGMHTAFHPLVPGLRQTRADEDSLDDIERFFDFELSAYWIYRLGREAFQWEG